ncbi:MurR/RpiR family transcriptional regulator [Vibrio vulnificus]|uniref:MurR/RpiR family transcriptional regulator n=1 Tax=Vibrio vulnificus TaxID=672 RepID=A0AAW4H8H6_VIBVL|nr:MurR/RpiR family transcriptional regulator [Vibrio vulnificus]EGQ7756016.1 MurR/RpiR family transcriptional regulator [Vibrio vulnificus]EGQ8077125.1 MurR/RpiR family transcriptional regulator [Vibrio vulnificus]EGR0633349.1 MurR/RpiR family transcriptional regulator [Vibrio vulnificus]EGR0637878.1 MurR/RpiR family transcriptional regulator [Vibrio vulnificus]EGR1513926.1 MurR/RpiR family transcriptional regulator [Vibrio vulnificus]
MGSPKNLLVRLRSNMEPFSKKLRVVADYILENAHDVQFQTITDLARNTQTSEATVVRLCRDMGYKGYSDFRMALAVDLSQTESRQQNHIEGDICDVSAQSAVDSLQDTAKLIDRKSLARIVERVHQAEFIGCIGVGASSIVGRYLAYRLIRIGKKAIMFEDTHLAAMSASRSRQGDLWFAVSSSGSTKEVIHAAGLAYKRDIPVVSLTNINHSPLSSLSTEMLVAARPEGPLTGGAFASKVGALLLVDVLVNSLLESYPEYKDSVQETAEVVIPLMAN